MYETGMVLAGRFRIVETHSGVGEVYVADDLQLGTRIVLRRLPSITAEVRREIQLARRLTHANVVRVFELITTEDAAFLSMEVLEGESLEQRLAREGKLPKAVAKRVGMQVLRAMEAAREAGVAHGALGPRQVMLVGDRAVVTGFTYTGSVEEDGVALDAMLAALGVRREELDAPRIVRQMRPGWRWLSGCAVAAALLVFGLYREELLAPRLSESVVRFYGDGETAIADGAYAKAEALFRQALREAPDFVAARLRLAEALEASDQIDRARGELMKALDGRTRGHADRLLRDATRYSLTSDWDKALGAARQRARLTGDSMAAGDVPRILERAGRLEDARKEFAEVLRRFPGQPGMMLAYARLLVANKKNDEAQQVLADSEKLYRALQNREGLAAVELERARLTPRIELSLQHARKSAELAAGAGSNTLLIRARLLEAIRSLSSGDLSHSEAMVREALALAGKYSLGGVAAEGLADLADVFFAQINYEEAARLLEQARGIARRFGAKRTEAEVLLRIGRIFPQMRQEARFQQGLDALDEAEGMFRQSGDRARLSFTIMRRGDAYRLMGKLPAAREQYERALREARTEAERNGVRIGLAALYQLEGNYEATAKLRSEIGEYFRRIGDKRQSHVYALQQARTLRLLGRFEESGAVVKRVMDERPATADLAEQCQVDLASIDFGLKRLDAALTKLEEITARTDPVQRKVLYDFRRYDLCMKYASSHWTDKAEKLCTELAPKVKGNPRHWLDVQDALAMAAMQKGDYPKAVRHATESVRQGGEAKSAEPLFFSLMLLAQAQHGARDPAWPKTRERAFQAQRAWENEIGPEAMKMSLARWYIAEHWDAVRNLR